MEKQSFTLHDHGLSYSKDRVPQFVFDRSPRRFASSDILEPVTMTRCDGVHTMKRYVLPGLMALVLVSMEASAQCTPGTRNNNLQNILPGNTVCATRASDKWQEQHRGSGTSGALWDFKKGPSDPIDPSRQVGTWSIGGPGNRQVTYTYTAFGSPVSHTFEVHGPTGGPYNFCGVGGAQNVLGATVVPGVTSCP